ncbi:hypothetical protein [Sphingomonas prati]|uniref:hypothetical protein n=1 Tax=Sphingomonas prati TaxID=1843237 RepID=UPI0012F648B9|nr:hypothetical protein [Sphingomonas prati]GGE98311.1 hypothetical protein GCM10011404_34320 [Sphingomonas prati]
MDSSSQLAIEEAERVLRRLKERDKSFSKALSAVAAAAATVGLLGAVTAFVSDRANIDIFGGSADIQSRSVREVRNAAALANLKRDIVALQQGQTSIGQLPPGGKMGAQLAAFNAKLNSVTQRQDRLEQAIQSNPEKALSMPLMRRDIDNMRDNNTQSLAAIKASVDQVYDLTKWLLGTLAVGVFSLAIANFFQRKGDG